MKVQLKKSEIINSEPVAKDRINTYIVLKY